MKNKSCFTYLVSNKKDLLWGIVVDNVGSAEVQPGYTHYPPSKHPENYCFGQDKGRILDNYQLIYISKGQGSCSFRSGRRIALSAGTLLIIPPYTWHTYEPDKGTGWTEHWIGLRGLDVDNWFHSGCIDASRRLLHIGVLEEAVGYYCRAQEIAMEEKPGYQQVLAGLANAILSLALYHSTNGGCVNNEEWALVRRAHELMRNNYLEGITLQEVARQMHLDNDAFRKMFKKYTNVSFSRYLTELRLQTARTLLMNTDWSIGAIASYLHYQSVSYFSALFRSYMGVSPSVYRNAYAEIKLERDR